VVCTKEIPVGRTTGALGVMVLSTQPVGSGIVTMRPVESTLGLTAGSLDATVKVASEGNAEPTGASVPVKTSVGALIYHIGLLIRI
jgi:hypothetical protein